MTWFSLCEPDLPAICLEAATPRDKVDDQDYECDDEQNVNEAASKMKAEAEKPQNDQNNEDCPKHENPLSASRAQESNKLPGRVSIDS